MATQKTRWASLEDWEKHRAIITDIYETQNMKLSDVIRFMEERHHFFATPRMYKTRFTKWGLQKTLRFEQVGELLRQNTDRAAAGKDSIRLIRGRPVDDRRLKKYLRSLPEERHNQLAELIRTSQPSPPAVSVVSCRTPSPSPTMSHLFPLRPPELFRLPEECISSMRSYVDGALSSGLWTLDPAVVVRAGPLFNFWNIGRTARKLLRAGQTRQAFPVLHNCFNEYKGLLAAQSPLLFLYTYLVGLVFADGYPELFLSFLRYATELTRIMYSENHPLYKLLENVYRMGPDVAKQNVNALFTAYLSFCQITPDSIAMLDVEGFIGVHFGEMQLHSWGVAEHVLRSMMARLEPHRHVDIMEAIWVDARDDLSSVLRKQDRWVEAAEILKESLQSRILPKYPLLQASAYRNLFIIARDTGRREEAVRVGHTMVRFASGIWEMTDNKTMTLVTDFITYLRTIEMNDVADRMDEDFNAAIDELSKQMGVFDLGI